VRDEARNLAQAFFLIARSAAKIEPDPLNINAWLFAGFTGKEARRQGGEMRAFFIARDKPHALVWIRYRVFVGV
jgi:hypothetical protein